MGSEMCIRDRYSTGTVQRDDISYDSTINFQGFSKYVVEKSVINGTAFASDFNNGHGMQYFVNGQVSRDMEWTNLNLQDILPTWQWWITSTDDNRLELDWDYGSKFYRYDSNGETYAFPYTQIGAYNGGSSLAIYGDLEAGKKQTVNLYKTDLQVLEGSKLSLTYNKISDNDLSDLALVLRFKDDPETLVVLPVSEAGQQTNGWRTVEFSLADFAGRDIAAIGVQIACQQAVTGYQVNLGQLKLSDGQSHAPAAPQNFVVDKVFDTTGEIEPVSYTHLTLPTKLEV